MTGQCSSDVDAPMFMDLVHGLICRLKFKHGESILLILHYFDSMDFLRENTDHHLHNSEKCVSNS